MRTRLALLLVVLCSLTVGQAREPQHAEPKAAELRQKLVQSLDTIAAGLDGVMGYAIVDLTSGDRIERLPSAGFATASTIKLTVLYELFKQAEEGRLSLDAVRPLDRQHVVAGSGVLVELTAPSMPLRDYATLMVVLSDNSATNLLIDAVGMPNVATRMSSLGLAQTKLRRKMIDLEAARRGDENVSTPADIARLLELIYRGEGLRKDSQQALLDILRKAKSTPMRRPLPANVNVANKPGSLEGVEVDAGIVYVPGRPYVFVAMTTYLTRNAAGDAAIAAASRAAFEYFDRVARSSEYGRSIR